MEEPSHYASHKAPQDFIAERFAAEHPEFKALTGWDTLGEWKAFNTGVQATEDAFIMALDKWDGKVESTAFYMALARKFRELNK